MSFTGKNLIDMGYEPGPWFKNALEMLAGHDPAETPRARIKEIIDAYVPAPKIQMRGDRVMPYGSIMAGDWEQNALWRNRK